jgi:hypothetical protein
VHSAGVQSLTTLIRASAADGTLRFPCNIEAANQYEAHDPARVTKTLSTSALRSLAVDLGGVQFSIPRKFLEDGWVEVVDKP